MKKIYYILSLSMAFIGSSCSDFLVEDPRTEISKEGVYNDPNTALGALKGCYASMASYDYFSFRYYHLLNETSGLGVSLKVNDKATTSLRLLSNDNDVERVYAAFYSTIESANDILGGMASSTISSEAIRNRITGEAHFIRSVAYFNLVRLFGRVPLVEESVESYAQAHIPREDVAKVYEFIESDLLKAFEQLPNPGDQEVGRPHKYAAQALLAKVYLTQAHLEKSDELIQKAYNAGKVVYDSKAYELTRPFSAQFGATHKNTKESIFEIQFGALQGGSRITETTFVYGSELLPNAVAGNTWGKTRPTKSAFDLFHEQDPRRDATFIYGSYLNIHETLPRRKNVLLYPTPQGEKGLFYRKGDSEYAAFKKFVDPSFVTVSNCNFVYYRYADLLLVLAEAANGLGLTSEAVVYVNEVLDRARDSDGDGVITDSEVYPLAIASTLGKSELSEIILTERLTELAGEVDEWFTLRAAGLDVFTDYIKAHNAKLDMLYPDGNLPDFVYKYSEDELDIKRNMLLPFPANEISRNNAIPEDDQNFGY